MFNKTNTLIYKICNYLLVLIVLFFIGLMFYSAFYLTDFDGDAIKYEFKHNGFYYSITNFLHDHGRWGQGLSNDHRFYENRPLTTLVFNVFHLFSLFYFLRVFIQKNIIIIATFIVYTSIMIFVGKGFLDYFLLFTMSLSYTLSISLSFIILGAYKRNNLKINYFIVGLIILASGLLELTGILLTIIFSCIVLHHFLFNKKIEKVSLIYFISSLISTLIVLLSPGSANRRAVSNTSINFDLKMFNTIYDVIITYFNYQVLIFVVFIGIVMLFIKKSKIQQLSKMYWLFIFIMLPFVPLVVIYIATGGEFIFVRIINISVILTIMSLMGILYLFLPNISNQYKNSILSLLSICYMSYIVVLTFYSKQEVFVFHNYFSQGNLYTLQNQVFNVDMQKFHLREEARREYLMMELNKKGIKEVPLVTDKDYTGSAIFGIPSELIKYKHDKKMGWHYYSVFNNGEEILLNNSLPNPLEFTTLHRIKKGKDKPIKTINGYKVYTNKKYHCVTIAIKNNKIPKSFTLNFDIKGKKENKEINVVEILKNKKYFYLKNLDYIMFSDIPYDAKNIQITGINEAINPTTLTEIFSTFTYGVNVKLKKIDDIDLFYIPTNEKDYKAENRLSQKNITPNKNEQIQFKTDKLFTKFRLDLGTKPFQEATINHFYMLRDTDTICSIKKDSILHYFMIMEQTTTYNEKLKTFSPKNNTQPDPMIIVTDKLKNILNNTVLQKKNN